MKDPAAPGEHVEIGSPAPPPAALASLRRAAGEQDLWWVMFDVSPVAASIVDIENELLFVNRAYRDLMRIDRDVHVTLDDVRARAHPDDLPALEATFAPMNVGEVDRVELDRRYVRHDGSVFWGHFVGTLLRDDDGAPVAVYGAVEDITERVETERAVATSEARFRALVKNAADAILVLSADGTMKYASPSADLIAGVPVEDWEADASYALVHPADREMVVEVFGRTMATPGAVDHLNFRVLHVDSSVRFVEAVVSNLLDEPAVGGIVINAHDVTAAVQAQAARTAFVASVSHELRTPIHGILGLAELLATSGLDPADDELVRSIARSADSLRVVVEDILDFSKLEVGRLAVGRAPVPVAEIADQIESLGGAPARARGLSFHLEVDDRLPASFFGDGARLRQIIANLLSNAVRFTPSGGIEVKLLRQAGDGRDGDRVRLEVRDTGIGIPADRAEQVFEAFSAAHAATSERFGGSGLGLAISRQLADLLGGHLRQEPNPGGGTAFVLELPLEAAESGEKLAGPPSTPDDQGRRPLVMVVEDNPTNQLVARGQLERLGYESVIYGSGADALDGLAARWSGDDDALHAVLMDWQMPGIDGLETTRRLRRMEAERGRVRVPVIAMTASAMTGDRERCLEAGMDDFLAKPVRLPVLGDMLQRWTAHPTGAG